MSSTFKPARGGQLGVTLIEVLVAMLVVSFGVLALSGLLAAASRTGKTSEYRAVSSLLASDITDRMRANKSALTLLNYELTDAYTEPTEPPSEAADCVDPDACTPGELADIDLAEWQIAIYYNLPGGRGYVTYDAAANAADIWLAWLDPEASNNEAKAGTDKDHQECPPGFQGKNPQPRCMYFRVGL